MPSIAGRIEPNSRRRALDDVGDCLAADPVAGMGAVERRKERTYRDISRLDPSSGTKTPIHGGCRLPTLSGHSAVAVGTALLAPFPTLPGVLDTCRSSQGAADGDRDGEIPALQRWYSLFETSGSKPVHREL